jgi:hypothetical protein
MTPQLKERRLTVLNRYRDRAGTVPDIRLSGQWLTRAGFIPGSRLAVAVEHGRLVVTVIARPRPLPCRRCGRGAGEE